MFNIFNPNINKEKYVVVKYFLKSKTTLRDAAWNVALGQSMGNPNQRNSYETDELFEKHSCIVMHKEEDLLKKKSGTVFIAFPSINIDFNTDGIGHFVCMIMGGNLDIDLIQKCQVKDVQFPVDVKKLLLPPKFGIKQIREFTNVFDKPLVGAIIKPKTGLTVDVLLNMTKELVEGGVNFIKEDEILASGVPFCPLEERVRAISDYLKDKRVIYCFAINSDPAHILERAKFVANNGGNGIHVNLHCGLGVYKSLRDLDLPLFLHFQKSGDKLLTNKKHDFHIDFNALCKLTAVFCDTAHAGMLSGGYGNDDEEDVKRFIKTLHEHNVMPTISCGMHPGLVQSMVKKIGNDFIAASGGAIHGHSGGSRAGAKAMVQAANGQVDEPEYQEAIKKWGLVD